MRFYIFIILLLLVIPLRAQEINIVTYLKQIESGDKESVLKVLPDLKKKNPNDPSLIFLEGILTEDASKAVAFFNEVLMKYPESKYADASVYRLSGYYNVLGDYKKSSSYAQLLKKNYPSSPYIKLTDQKIPQEKSPKVKDVKTTGIYKYTIQAGAFSSRENAESLKKQFIDTGFSSEIKEKNIAGTIFHIVYTGKFADEEEARNFLVTINKQFNLDGRVVSINW